MRRNLTHIYILFAGLGSVCIVKNCDGGLKNAVRGVFEAVLKRFQRVTTGGDVPLVFFRSRGPRKKRTRPISSHLDRTSLVKKGFIIWNKTPNHDQFSSRDKARISSGQDNSILPARVANRSARFG